MKHYLLALALICALATAGAQTEGGAVWNGDERKLYQYLKDQGAPDDIILSVMFTRDRREIEGRRINILFPKGMTRWSGTPNIAIDKLNDVYDERRMLLRSIMGASLDLTLVKNDVITLTKWGDLTDTEIVNVKRVYERYDSIMAHNQPFSASFDKKTFEWNCQFNAAFEKDIRRVLGAKADDFLTFNSPVNRGLSAELAGADIEVDETTFRRLVDETRGLRADLLLNIQTMTHITARQKQVQMYQRVLGADKALAVACANDAAFGRLNAIASGDADAKLAFFFQYLEGLSRMSSIPADPFEPSAEAVAQLRVEQGKLFALVQANVPEDKLAAFIGTREGHFVKRWRG